MAGTKERLLKDMGDLAEELGTVPRTVDMARHGGYDPVVYYEEFGSWDEALRQAGLDPDCISAPEGTPEGGTGTGGTEKEGTKGKDESEESGYRHIAEARSGHSSAEEGLLEDIRLFYETYSRAPTQQDIEETVWMSPKEEYEEAFGSVAEASREAGVIEDSHHEANKTSTADADELLGEVKKYEGLYGEVPTADEMDAQFWTHPASEYLEEFGDWDTVLKKAGLTGEN